MFNIDMMFKPKYEPHLLQTHGFGMLFNVFFQLKDPRLNYQVTFSQYYYLPNSVPTQVIDFKI